METETNSSIVRNLTRVGVVTIGLALTTVATPAFAAPPSSWEDPVNDSALQALLLLVGAPAAIIAVIALLVYLPSMMRSRSAGNAVAFQDRPEWFGGPRQGAEAPSVTEADPVGTTDKGGASARW